MSDDNASGFPVTTVEWDNARKMRELEVKLRALFEQIEKSTTGFDKTQAKQHNDRVDDAQGILELLESYASQGRDHDLAKFYRILFVKCYDYLAKV